MRREGKRKIPYQWRLFLPLVLILWVILFSVAGWQVYRNIKYKELFVERHLKIVNKRVVHALKSDDWRTLDKYKQYIREFYRSDELFDDIRMTIYDQNWDIVDTLGRPISIEPEEKLFMDTTLFERYSNTLSIDNPERQKAYYLASPVSIKGDNFLVVSSLPSDEVLGRQIVGELKYLWIVVFFVALIITVLAYITINHLAKNIKLLREFASRTADEPNFVPSDDFAHDELGDIARKIVKIYNDRRTAREQMEREHQVTVHTVEEKARQKRQLTNNINHELKTPIGVIKGYLDTIVDSPDMDAETQRHFIKKARDHADRLVNLVADVSAITRLEEGENQISTEQLDFHEIVYVFAHDAHDSGMLGHFNIDFNIPLGTYVNGNNNLLIGLLMNLTKNAVNYSGGNRIVVELMEETGTHYKFRFYDNGHGVPDSALDHLFDHFYRIDSGRARKAGGTGLGLAIVFNTIKAHKGTILAVNRPEGGLEFQFTLQKWTE